MFYITFSLFSAFFAVDNFFSNEFSCHLFVFISLLQTFHREKMMIHIYFSPFWLMSKACWNMQTSVEFEIRDVITRWIDQPKSVAQLTQVKVTKIYVCICLFIQTFPLEMFMNCTNGSSSTEHKIFYIHSNTHTQREWAA